MALAALALADMEMNPNPRLIDFSLLGFPFLSYISFTFFTSNVLFNTDMPFYFSTS